MCYNKNDIKKERLIVLKPGHKRSDALTRIYNSKEWLSGCEREGKDISAERERKEKKEEDLKS